MQAPQPAQEPKSPEPLKRLMHNEHDTNQYAEGSKPLQRLTPEERMARGYVGRSFVSGSKKFTLDYHWNTTMAVLFGTVNILYVPPLLSITITLTYTSLLLVVTLCIIHLLFSSLLVLLFLYGTEQVQGTGHWVSIHSNSSYLSFLFSLFNLFSLYLLQSSVDKGDTSSECSHLPVLLISPLSSILPYPPFLLWQRKQFSHKCEGPPGSAHGGSIAAILDDSMSQACNWHLIDESAAKNLPVSFSFYLFLFSVLFLVLFLLSFFFFFFDTEDKENGDGNIAGEVWYSHPSRYPCSFCGLCSKVFKDCLCPPSLPSSLSPLLSYPILLYWFFSFLFLLNNSQVDRKVFMRGVITNEKGTSPPLLLSSSPPPLLPSPPPLLQQIRLEQDKTRQNEIKSNQIN